MPELLTVALLALLPPAGNFAGGLLAESLPVTDRWLNRALHAAAGVVIAVVAFEIFPRRSTLLHRGSWRWPSWRAACCTW